MEDTILSVQNLSIDFVSKKSTIPIVRNISFSLQKQKICCLIGESGSGKSMTVRALINLLPKTMLIREKSQIEFSVDSVFCIFQDPINSFNPSVRVKKQLFHMARGYRLISKKNFEKELTQILTRLNFEHPRQAMRKYPFELSGGMLQRLMIATAILIKPDLIIADEPTTALDVTVQKQILKEFININRELQIAMLFITHDFGVVAEIADEVLVMNNGEIIEHNDVYSIFKNPQNEYTKKLIKASERKL